MLYKLARSPIGKLVFGKRTTKQWDSLYSLYVYREPIEPTWVLYESHVGKGMICNPFALYQAFEKMPEFGDYQHIWVINDKNEIARLKEENAGTPNLRFVMYHSAEYAYYLAKAKYLINNTSFSAVFAKRDEQVYLNTWHSITVKSLGYDTPDGNRVIKNMIRNMLMADYILSPNKFMTEIFDDSFRLRDVYNGRYVEEGYPRNDLVVNTAPETIIRKLENRGTVVDRNKKIILYAPTWSGNNALRPEIDMTKYTDLYDYLSEHIDMNEYQLLVKPHHVVYSRLSKEELNSGRYISAAIDANELLSVVDILITDYSSIYFDYMVAKKPILFYIPDYEKYSETRGIYFGLDELPGPCSFDLEDLAKNINEIERVKVDYKEVFDKTFAWACAYDDGHVSERIMDLLIRGNTNYRVLAPKQTDKKTILMSIGGLAVNGLTSAALSLLRTIDYNKYDITLFVQPLKGKDQNRNFDALPSELRVILRNGPTPKIECTAAYSEVLAKAFLASPEAIEEMRGIMQREYVRCLGNATFDYIIDFSGYNSFFNLLTLLGGNNQNAKRFIWQHSDQLKDFTNKEKTAINHKKLSPKAMKTFYERYDKIVSSTKSIYHVNKKNFATPETADKFTYVTNMMDEQRIDTLLAETVKFEDGCVVFEEVVKGETKKIRIPFNDARTHFVTMGRCMPEKNHANLIRALKMLVDEGKDVDLYLIGGPLQKSLTALADELGLSDRVIITGSIANPFAILKRCHCFVFPSLYESQGLAVLEARCVGLPIVVSNYEAVDSVTLDDQQYILSGFEAADIYVGMAAYLDGKVPADYTFDVHAYNRAGHRELDALLHS